MLYRRRPRRPRLYFEPDSVTDSRRSAQDVARLEPVRFFTDGQCRDYRDGEGPVRVRTHGEAWDPTADPRRVRMIHMSGPRPYDSE